MSSQILKARQMREANIVTVQLSDDTHVKCRRDDMTVLVFEGRVPMPMLAAVQKMIEMPDATAEERVLALGPEQGKSLVETMRSHACRVSVDPVIVMEPDGNPDHLEVELLGLQDLTAIWMATATVPGMGVSDAARFRGESSPAPVADVPVGADV